MSEQNNINLLVAVDISYEQHVAIYGYFSCNKLLYISSLFGTAGGYTFIIWTTDTSSLLLHPSPIYLGFTAHISVGLREFLFFCIRDSFLYCIHNKYNYNI